MTIIHIDNRSDIVKHSIGALNVEEAIPLNSTQLTQNIDLDSH